MEIEMTQPPGLGPEPFNTACYSMRGRLAQPLKHRYAASGIENDVWDGWEWRWDGGKWSCLVARY